jgi:hypothetical protein
MEVHGVHVRGEVEDLPDLGRARRWRSPSSTMDHHYPFRPLAFGGHHEVSPRPNGVLVQLPPAKRTSHYAEASGFLGLGTTSSRFDIGSAAGRFDADGARLRCRHGQAPVQDPLTLTSRRTVRNVMAGS